MLITVIYLFSDTPESATSTDNGKLDPRDQTAITNEDDTTTSDDEIVNVINVDK